MKEGHYKNLYSLGRFPPINYFVGGKLFCPCLFFSRNTGEVRDFGLLLWLQLLISVVLSEAIFHVLRPLPKTQQEMLKNREVFAKSRELFNETRALFAQLGGLSLQTRKKREQTVRAFLFYCHYWLENVIPLGLEPRTHALEGRCSNPTELRNQTFYEQSLGFAGANIAIFSVETINIARKITFIRRNLVRALGHASIYEARRTAIAVSRAGKRTRLKTRGNIGRAHTATDQSAMASHKSAGAVA